jgi:hypothetical protein
VIVSLLFIYAWPRFSFFEGFFLDYIDRRQGREGRKSLREGFFASWALQCWDMSVMRDEKNIRVIVWFGNKTLPCPVRLGLTLYSMLLWKLSIQSFERKQREYILIFLSGLVGEHDA